MSSRFVSGGITDTKTGDIAPAHPAPSDTTNTSSSSSSSSKKSEEWAAVQAQLEEERRRRQQQREAAQTGTAGEEKSLYEVLQANKAAKQAAFEEANKIKNQFRPLDDDEVEFLDGVRERKRLEEERLRRETEEGLRGFRELQQKASASGEGPEDEGAAADAGDVGGWSVGRKRKRRKDESEGVLKGLKRRSSSAADGGEGAKVEEKGRDAAADAAAGQVGSAAAPKGAQDTQAPLAKPATPAAAKPKAGLVDYGSDDDSD
ncbi:hypothetical protein N8I77_000869 [Diaporthe amygdali]|uniref:FAM192A/Fyv6 N-terminal domain-containing protein n=1 Tax=Phomopsis amygdali TaxID=1214568 RepID=A0AAD9SQH4_PHOAM|nr:hypothetical protein N8I77_000869 [Diaporthe amygdali]